MTNTDKVEHGLHARDYLARARARLASASPENLFYAAFELRCGIEARLQQYLEAQRETTGRIKQGWRIAKLSRRLERHFRTGDQVVRIAMREPDGRVFYELVYTPVTARLQKMGERLGSLLHAQTKCRPPTDKWWSETRQFLESVVEELEKAVRGNLLGAPLWNPRTKRVFTVSEPFPNESPQEHKAAIGRVGRRFLAQVEFLNEQTAKDSS